MVLFTAEPRLSVLLDNNFVIGASCAVVILILTIVFVLIILKRKTALNRQDNQQGHHLFLFAYCNDKFIIMYSVNDPYSNNKMHDHVVISNDSYNIVLNWCMDVLLWAGTSRPILWNKNLRSLCVSAGWMYKLSVLYLYFLMDNWLYKWYFILYEK